MKPISDEIKGVTLKLRSIFVSKTYSRHFCCRINYVERKPKQFKVLFQKTHILVEVIRLKKILLHPKNFRVC